MRNERSSHGAGMIQKSGSEQSSLGKSIASSARWTIGLRLAERSIGLISTLILARILLPEDYGLVAMGTAIVGALEAIQAFGFEWAIIQRGTRDRRFLDTAWTLNVIFGVLTAALLCAAAPLAAAFFSEPRISNVLFVLALTSAISRSRNIGIVLFEQTMQFRPIFAISITRKLIAFGTMLVLAFTFENYWALLGGLVADAVTDVAMTYWMHKYRPRLSLAASRELFGFSTWLMLNNLLFFVSHRGSEFVIGNRAGAAALGTYNVAYELANLPTTELVQPIMRAAFPGYAQLNKDLTKLAPLFLKVFGMVALFIIPIAIGLACISRPFVDVLLGANWVGVAGLIPPLALFGGVRALQGTTGSIYIALGKPHLQTMLTATYIVFGVGTFSLTLAWKTIELASWSLFTAALIVGAVSMVLVCKELRLSPRTILASTFRPLAASVLMAAATVYTGELLHELNTFSSIITLILLIAVGAISFLATLTLLWVLAGCPSGPESEVLALARQRLDKNSLNR